MGGSVGEEVTGVGGSTASQSLLFLLPPVQAHPAQQSLSFLQVDPAQRRRSNSFAAEDSGAEEDDSGAVAEAPPQTHSPVVKHCIAGLSEQCPIPQGVGLDVGFDVGDAVGVNEGGDVGGGVGCDR